MKPAPEGWQLEGDSAELYERYLVPAVTLPWAVDLVERIGVQPADRVLDVACGTGGERSASATLVGRFSPRTGVVEGDAVEVSVDQRALHFFDPETGLAIRRT